MTTTFSTEQIRTFVIDVGERAGKTFAQGAAGAAGAVLLTVDAANVVTASWWDQLVVAALVGGLSAIASVLTSFASAVRTGTASLSTKVAQSAVLPGAHAVDVPGVLMSTTDGPSIDIPLPPADNYTPRDFEPQASSDFGFRPANITLDGRVIAESLSKIKQSGLGLS